MAEQLANSLNKSEGNMDFKRVFGLIIVAIGLVALLHNFNIIEVNFSFVVSVIMLIVGVLCLRLYFKKERSALLLIVTLVSLFWGLGMLIYEFNFISYHIKNQFLLFGVGIGFLTIYFYNTKQWWAIIPGGCILILFTVDLLDEIFYLQTGLPTFLLISGIGLLFFYLYLIRDEKNRLFWAIYPATGLFLFSLFQLYLSSRRTSVHIMIAVILIIFGSLLVIRSFFGSDSKSRQESLSDQESENTDLTSDSENKDPNMQENGEKSVSKP